MASIPELLSFLLLVCFLTVLDILRSLITIMSANNNNNNNHNNNSNALQNPVSPKPTEGNSKQESENTVTNELLTFQHLKHYPLVNSTKSAIELIPLSKSVFSIMGNSFSFVRSYQPMKYIVGRSDTLTNRALDEIDKWLPSLQTVEVQDITTPITKPVNDTVETVQNTITAVNGSVNKNFVDPTKSALGSVKEEFQNHVYDAEGKGIISSQADLMVAPLNHTLEQFVDNHFPNTKKVPTEGHASEISRTFKIVGNLISRGEKEKEKEKESLDKSKPEKTKS